MGIVIKNDTITTTGLQMSDLKIIHDTINETKFLNDFNVLDIMSLRRNYSDVDYFIELLAVYNLYTYSHDKSVTRKAINITYKNCLNIMLNSESRVRCRSNGKSSVIKGASVSVLVIKKMDHIYNQLTGSHILHAI